MQFRYTISTYFFKNYYKLNELPGEVYTVLDPCTVDADEPELIVTLRLAYCRFSFNTIDLDGVQFARSERYEGLILHGGGHVGLQ